MTLGHSAEASLWSNVAPHEGLSPSGFVLFSLGFFLDLDYSAALTGQELSLQTTTCFYGLAWSIWL